MSVIVHRWHSKFNKRWYKRCRQKSYRCLFPHSPHTLILFVYFGFFLNFCIIFWFGLQLRHLPPWLFQKLERFSFSRVIVKHWSRFVIVFERAYCNLRNETKWKNVICEFNSNRNMRNGNISILNQKSVIFKLVLLKIIQRRNCAVLIINVRSGMRDMTLNFKPENGVSVKREDCSVRLYQQCFYSKGANIKIVIAHENFMLLS